MKLTFLIAGCSGAVAVLGAPAPAAAPSTAWTPAMAGYFDVAFRYIQDVKAGQAPSPTCDLSKAAMPVAPTPLPSPEGLTLAHVAVGRGIQNYTCANATATPSLLGAVASFYNASCVAASYPDLLALLPNIALQLPLPAAPNAPLEPSDLVLSSHHFFANATTPVFTFDAPNAPPLGTVEAQKGSSSDAPAGSVAGAYGRGDGAVAWLYLTSRPTTVGNIKAVYRLSTAGGAAPPTCQGQPSAFSVDYSATYWFYQ